MPEGWGWEAAKGGAEEKKWGKVHAQTGAVGQCGSFGLERAWASACPQPFLSPGNSPRKGRAAQATDSPCAAGPAQAHNARARLRKAKRIVRVVLSLTNLRDRRVSQKKAWLFSAQELFPTNPTHFVVLLVQRPAVLLCRRPCTMVLLCTAWKCCSSASPRSCGGFFLCARITRKTKGTATHTN